MSVECCRCGRSVKRLRILQDFSRSFRSRQEPGTIFYAATQADLSLYQALVRKVRTEVQSLMKFDDEHKPYFSTEPHFTLGRKLKPWQYEKAWLDYSTKHFTGRFIAKEMLLLKRFEGDKNWQVARHFEFQNLPVTTRQGELF